MGIKLKLRIWSNISECTWITLHFSKNIEIVTRKALQVSNNVAKILPNTYGAAEGKRRLLASVAESITCYASSTWAKALDFKKNVRQLEKTKSSGIESL